MKNTVIFDLDGLLIDSEIISYRIYHDGQKNMGKRSQEKITSIIIVGKRQTGI